MKSDTNAAERFLSIVSEDFGIERGHPLPLGAPLRRNGVNFSVFSRHATAVYLVIFMPGDTESIAEFPLSPQYNKTGDVWHAFVRGIDPGIEYGYRVAGDPDDPSPLHRFDPAKVLVDLYALALSGGNRWGETLHLAVIAPDGRVGRPRHSLVVDDVFDWEQDQQLNTHPADAVIYELHVRGFTRHPSAGVAHPGTFAGLVEKIPYLRELGVTAVELMPITEFEEVDNPRVNPFTGQRLMNYWGYQPLSFFAPKAAYASRGDSAGAVREFKEMVKAMHRAGLEVILDMVFNHTAEGGETGPTLSWRGLDNSIYYLVEPASGAYLNFSGCGNTLNCNHPVVRSLIMDSLRYWVTEMHVDGFRFDLASILGRGRDGEVLANPPLLEQIEADPVLGHTKLIAEAWDAAGLYQVGAFPTWGRWAEWNGRFRDDVRRFVRGDGGMVSALASRLTGSADLYQGAGRAPYHSVNFITSHDGFTLADLVTYGQKRNEANGEHNADGAGDDLGWNCGHEGPGGAPEIQALRLRQAKNMLALLLLSQGTPMILAGDELGRSQRGNNNAYCHDDDTTWLDWGLAETNGGLRRFCRELIRFRKGEPLLRTRSYASPANGLAVEFAWHGVAPGRPDWSWDSRSLALQISGGRPRRDIYLIANAYWGALRFELPGLDGGRAWHLLLDTSQPSPLDIHEPGARPGFRDRRDYVAGSRSVAVFTTQPG